MKEVKTMSKKGVWDDEIEERGEKKINRNRCKGCGRRIEGKGKCEECQKVEAWMLINIVKKEHHL